MKLYMPTNLDELALRLNKVLQESQRRVSVLTIHSLINKIYDRARIKVYS